MILTALILTPFLMAAGLFIFPQKWTSKAAVCLSFLYFLFSLCLFFFFDSKQAALQLVERVKLFESLGIDYFVGIDGISFWMVLLTAFLLPLAVLGSAGQVTKSPRGFLSCLFLLTGFVEGSFLALDGVLFYIFFEGSLLPLFFLILIWGGEKRTYAAFKFFIYTAFGSLFMLAGISALMFLTKEAQGHFSASLLDFYHLNIPFIGNYFLNPQGLLFFCFFLAFAIKAPLFPFHTWLPLAHVQAPTAGSVFLAAVVLKMGTYGFLRFVLPLFPEASAYYSPFVCFLAVLGIIYGALMALAQSDFKKLIAYSSVSHIGYVLLGFFVFNIYGLSGGYFQMIAHGLSSAGLFFLVGMIYDRTRTRDLNEYGGLAGEAPAYSAVFFLISLSAIAFPLTGGFVAEFLVLLGTFAGAGVWIPFAILGVVLGAVYMLFLIYKVFFGPYKRPPIKDLTPKEKIILTPIVVFTFMLGVFPHFIFDISNKSFDHLLENRFNYRLWIKDKSFKAVELSIKTKADQTQKE